MNYKLEITNEEGDVEFLCETDNYELLLERQGAYERKVKSN